MESNIKDSFSKEINKSELMKESLSAEISKEKELPEKSGESKMPDEPQSPKKLKETNQSIDSKESKEGKEQKENPKEIIEVKVEQDKLIKEKNEENSTKKKENIINIDSAEEIQENKATTEVSISGYSSNNKEMDKTKEDIYNEKDESQGNNFRKKDGINDLIFPIITVKKLEEAKNSEYDSLSALNNALSKSQIDFYSMDLKIPYNLCENNKFSSQLSAEQNSITNSMNNSSSSFNLNYFQNPNPFTKNYSGRKYQKNFLLSHFVPVTLSCSMDTHIVGKYGKKFVQNEKEFFSKIIKIADVSNINEFWQFFQHLKKPSQCPTGTDYHVFKKGIVPMWEDNMNKNGGKLSVLLTWKYSNLIWEEVTFNFCKGLLPYYVFINGIVISMRPNFVVLSFWIKIRNNQFVEKIRYALANMLQTPSNNCFDFIAFN